jgi:putative membrane protein
LIRGYSDHAANERTFLAWVRTGIAVTAFGFVIEKFDLFVLTMASTNLTGPASRILLEKLSGPFGRYDGLVLIIVGVVLIAAAAVRFVRIGRWLDDPQDHSVNGIRTELILSALLALAVASFSFYLALG